MNFYTHTPREIIFIRCFSDDSDYIHLIKLMKKLDNDTQNQKVVSYITQTCNEEGSIRDARIQRIYTDREVQEKEAGYLRDELCELPVVGGL